VVVDATAFTLQNCVEASLGFTSGETVAVVNVGATASTISIIVEGMPAYGRDLSSGGHSYTEALARNLAVAPEEAERIKRGQQPPADPALFERTMLQVSEAIAAEVHRSLDFFLGAVAEAAPARIVLAGGSALVPSLRPALAERSRLPVTLLDPFARVQVDRGASTSRRCGPAPRSRRSRSAWRCARRGRAVIRINLLPPSARRRRRRQPVREGVILGAMSLGWAVLISVGYLWIAATEAEVAERRAQVEALVAQRRRSRPASRRSRAVRSATGPARTPSTACRPRGARRPRCCSSWPRRSPETRPPRRSPPTSGPLVLPRAAAATAACGA
jgi:hypothetical protein